MNVEVMRNTLYKAYLDDFAAFCSNLGGTTAELMGLDRDELRRALTARVMQATKAGSRI